MKPSARESGLEFKVGLFVCFGLLIIGAMILEFGLGGSQLFKTYYDLKVDLPNASGLLKGSDVLLAGARVGYVSTKPALSGNLAAVRVTVKIENDIKIPKGAIFKVDSSGLLGDKFISVQMQDGFDASKFNASDPSQIYNSGDVITGGHTPDLTEIVANAQKKLNEVMDNFQTTINGLKSGVLSPESMKNLQDTFANFKSISGNWDEFSTHLPPLGKSAQETVDKANETMASVHQAVDALNSFVDKATHGDGLIGQLINNRQLSENFNALIENMRKHGPVFYHDTAAPPAPTPSRDKRSH